MSAFTSFAFYTSGTPSGSPPTGAQRTLPDRLQDIHDVKDFGAVGDGVTDDWAAITACLAWNNLNYLAASDNQVATFTGSIAYSPSFEGTISGSVLTASANGALTLGTITVNSYTYNSTTGLVTLNLASSVSFGAGVSIWVDGLNIIQLTGAQTSVSASGTTVTYTGPTGLTGTPSGTGSLIVGGQLVAGQTFSGTASFTVASFTYNMSSGVTVLTLTTPPSAAFNTSDTINVSGLTMTGPAGTGPNGSFTPSAVSGSTVTYTGPTGITGSPSGGGSFTVNISGTISSQASGPAGGAGTYNISFSDNFSTPVTFSTNCVLTASSVTGSINVGDSVLNHAGRDSAPNVIQQDIFAKTTIVSGAGGGAGVYVLSWDQNFVSQAMMTASVVFNINSVFPNLVRPNDYVTDLDNASLGNPSEPTLPEITFFNGIQTITANYVHGRIMVGDRIQINKTDKGTIYFPPGNYFVSKPILLEISIPDNFTAHFLGQGNASTVTGNFADYVFSRGAEGAGFPPYMVLEKLNIVNTNTNGGGARFGNLVLAYVKDCTFTANRGLNFASSDSDAGIVEGAISIDSGVENCVFTPGVGNVTGSIGLVYTAEGSVLNCRFLGYETGVITCGGQPGQNFRGVYFEQCTTGFRPATFPDGTPNSSVFSMHGAHFKNCSTAIWFHGGCQGAMSGILIEGTNGQAPGGMNPQYGILDGDGGSGTEIGQFRLSGVVVRGQFDQYGIYLRGGQFADSAVFSGISVSNSSGLGNWHFDNVGGGPGVWCNFPQLIACDVRHIYPVIDLAGSSNSDSSGFTVNVSDSNTATWGAIPGSGGSTHALVFWNGTNWTVMGI